MKQDNEFSQLKYSKIIALLFVGNTLEYYDFLLFSHLSLIIMPLFFPALTPINSNILSLSLFGISFLIRPIGGFVLGKIADTKGRKKALIKSVQWAVIPALGFAILPDSSVIGVSASFIFILLRVIQGFALGGEYPIAGLYLMELSSKHRGLLSSIFSSTVALGSLLGLGVAFLCKISFMPDWIWRIGFLIGALGSLISYLMRRELIEITILNNCEITSSDNSIVIRRIIVFVTSMLISICTWIPTTYCNFYLTQILKKPNSEVFYANFIYLALFLFLLPVAGKIFDLVRCYKKYMCWVTIMICPLCFISNFFLIKGDIFYTQIGLAINSAIVGGPIHALMHNLFPSVSRGKNIGIFFMLGLCVGGIVPSSLSYMVSKTRIDFLPSFLVLIISIATFFLYKKSKIE